MKFVLVALLAGLGVFALAGTVPETGKFKVADKVFLEKQKQILGLFYYVNQPSYFKEHIEISKTFKPDAAQFTKPEVYKYFYQLYQYGLLPRGQIFSVFYEEHLKQAIALFKVFYYAKDFDTFYKTAVWARNNVNEGLFLYSLSVAIVHRDDTYGIVLPPIYEVYPYYFHNSEVINKVQQYKQQYNGQDFKTEGSTFNGYTIDSNYSGYYLNLHPEQSLSYFTEDLGLNAYYYYYNIYYPFWLGGDDFNFKSERRGELFYFFYQQLLARYYQERLSNGFGDIEFFNWEVPFETSYYPSLTYPNGLEFPSRPKFAKLSEYFYNYGQKWSFKGVYGYSYSLIQDYERRIFDAIDSGIVYTEDGQKFNLYTEEGFNVLGNLIESNADSPFRRYFGAYTTFARHLLGYSTQPQDKYKVVPSALEHFETSLRDPAFYQFFKRVILSFQRYKFNLPSYTAQELYFPGVQVKNVEFDRLVTYFDTFYSDLKYAAYVTPEEFQSHKFNVRARQYRLNHKPFTYKIYVNSDKEQDAVVRIYFGPKYDEYGRVLNISENRLNFVQFAEYKYTLKAGENVISPYTYESFYAKDRTSYYNLYKHVLGALNGEEQFKLDGTEAFWTFPRRLLLPKGTYGGQDYQFYVIVSPYTPYKYSKDVDSTQFYYPKLGTGKLFTDNYALGFPFDRPIEYESFFYTVPNAYFYNTKIYHRNEADINASTASQI